MYVLQIVSLCNLARQWLPSIVKSFNDFFFSNLLETLSTADFSRLKPFEPGQPELFAPYLEKLMGFSR